MTNDELINIIDQEEKNSIGEFSGELANQRTMAMDYYYGRPYGNELEGRSQFVTTEVMDAIESMMPSIMAIFTSSDEIVRFEPEGPEDEQSAQQTTDWVNYVFSRVNNGYVALYCAVKDCLLQKNGFLKVYWEEFTDQGKETYENLSDDEFQYMMNDPELEVIEHSVEEGELGPVHSAVFRRTQNSGKICIDPLPPEQVKVSRETANDLKKARVVIHKQKMSLSRLREMGFDVSDDLNDFESDDFNQERVSRLQYDDQNVGQKDDGLDPSTREVWVSEAYIRVDFDDDGFAELRKVTKVGKTLLLNEEIDSLPIVTGTPILMPHKLYGLSLADQIMDIQLEKSMATRNLFDNFYFLNNGRWEVLDGMVNLDDMLTSRPGGVVRSKVLGGVKRLDTPALGAQAFNLLGYLDQIKESRIGKRTFAPGPNEELLKSTATGAEIFRSWDAERTLLIARTLAETLVKDLFSKIFELSSKHVKKTQMIRLRNQWVQIDPREWKKKYNMTVTVGLGTGSQQQTLQGAMGILQIQGEMAKLGLMGRVVSEANLYHAAREYAKAQFPKQADLFFTNPQTLPPPQPQVDPKVQLQAQKAQMSDAQKRDKMKLDFIEGEKDRQHEIEMQNREWMYEGQDKMLERRDKNVDRAIDMKKHKDELSLETLRELFSNILSEREQSLKERAQVVSEAQAASESTASVGRKSDAYMKDKIVEDLVATKTESSQKIEQVAGAVQEVMGEVDRLRQEMNDDAVVKAEAVRDKSGKMVAVVLTQKDGTTRQIQTMLH